MSFIHVRSEKDAKEYNEAMKQHSMIVMFYADFCSHCNEIKPMIMNKFIPYMRENHKNTMFAMVNVGEEGYSKINGFGKEIDGVPTIMYFSPNQASRKEYNPKGQRTFESLQEFTENVHKQIGGKKKRRSTIRRKKSIRKKKYSKRNNKTKRRKNNRK